MPDRLAQPGRHLSSRVPAVLYNLCVRRHPGPQAVHAQPPHNQLPAAVLPLYDRAYFHPEPRAAQLLRVHGRIERFQQREPGGALLICVPILRLTNSDSHDQLLDSGDLQN